MNISLVMVSKSAESGAGLVFNAKSAFSYDFVIIRLLKHKCLNIYTKNFTQITNYCLSFYYKNHPEKE